MKKIDFRSLLCKAAMFALTTTALSLEAAQGQEKTIGNFKLPVAAKKTPPREDFKIFDWGDGAFWAGKGIDLGTSHGKREFGAFKDERGLFNTTANAIGSGAAWGFVKFAEWKWLHHPKDRWKMRIIKAGAGVVFALVGGLHNSRVKRVR